MQAEPGRPSATIGARGVLALLVLNVALGIAVTVKGATVPGTMASFATNEQGIGVLFAGVTAGGTIAVIAGGWLSDVLGARLPVALGLAVSVVAFAVFGRVASLAPAQVVLFGSGLGSGLVQAGSIALCARIGGQRGRGLMNLSQSLYGVGAVLGPLLAAAVLAAGLGWQAAYESTAAISLVCMLAVGILPATAGAGGARQPPPLRLLAPSVLWALALLGALEVTLEVGTGEWTSEFFLQRFGTSAGAAALVAGLYWTGIALGRLLVGLYGRRVAPSRIVLLACLLVPPIVLSTVLNPWLPVQVLLAIAAGIALAPIFPTILAWGADVDPRSGGFIGGFLAAAGVGGASVLRPAMTFLAARQGLAAGFLFFAALALVMALIALLLVRRDDQLTIA
jgi:fucose permease